MASEYKKRGPQTRLQQVTLPIRTDTDRNALPRSPRDEDGNPFLNKEPTLLSSASGRDVNDN